MTIEIWSDIICPFCYIGKRRLEQALNVLQLQDSVEIQWKSYQLDPLSPKYSDNDVYDYLAERKGITRDQSILMHKNVVDMAKSVGLDYHFERAKVANSRDALRLVKLASTEGLENEAEEALFKAYFVDGRHISDHVALTEIGAEIGLHEESIQKMLKSDDFDSDIETDIYEAKQLGIKGVPFFLFNRKLAVSGAQPIDVFIQALTQALDSK